MGRAFWEGEVMSGILCHQSSHGTHLIPITCLLIPHTCCTSSISSISAHSQHFLLVRSTVHYPEPYQSLSFVYPVCTYPQILQRSSDPDLLDSSTIPNLPAKDTASAFSDKSPRTVFLLTSSPLPPPHSATLSIKPPVFALTLCLLPVCCDNKRFAHVM